MLTNKKIIFILIILLTVALFSGCSNNSDSYYDVYGTITTKEFNSPIAGAKITISEETDITDSEGEYSISNVKNGEHLWEIESSDYQNFSKTINVDGNKLVNAELVLSTGSASVSGDISLYNKTGYISTSSTTTKKSTMTLNTTENKKYKKGEVIVKYKESLSTQSIQNVQSKQNLQRMNALNSSKGKMVKYKIPDNKNVEEVVEHYDNLEEVEWAEPNYIAYILAIPSDTDYNEQWGFINLNMEAAWDEKRDSDSVTVAVLDTGIIPEHPDLENNLSDEGADFVGGTQTDDPSNYNITDKDPTDKTPYENGGSHGTHVSGIIGAVSNNDLGVAGTNWSTNILPIRVLDTDGSGSYWDIAEGMYYSVDKGAEIINLSLGATTDSDTLHTAIQDAYNSGAVLIAAAGNSGDNSVIFPAAYDETIAVGATDKNNSLTDYSNYGPKLDLVAPGGGDTYSIYSTWGYYDGSSTVSGYAYMKGTSMATPYVSGVAALLLADGVNPRDIRKRLTSTTVDLGPSGRDDYYGYGLVDGYGALLNQKLKNPYVFAAQKKNGDIYVKSEVIRINDDGFYKLNEVVAEEVCIVGWRDVNENQKIDAGDYYGDSSTINISENSLHSASFNMYYKSDSSSTRMEVKGLPKVETK